MKKRINLYQHKPKKAAFSVDLKSLSGSALLVLGVTVVLLAIGFGLQFYNAIQQEKLVALKAEKQQLEQQVQALQDAFKGQKVSDNITTEKTRLEREIASRKQLLTLLYQVDPSQVTYFSVYMQGLAQAATGDSWLTAFELDTTDGSFVLSGGAVAGPAVPEWFKVLGQTQAFNGISVVSLNVEAGDTGIEFTAETKLRIND